MNKTGLGIGTYKYLAIDTILITVCSCLCFPVWLQTSQIVASVKKWFLFKEHSVSNKQAFP